MKGTYILLVLAVLAGLSYVSYLITFRLFDANSDGHLTKEELHDGISRIMDPIDKNEKNELVQEIVALKKHVVKLEEEVLDLRKTCDPTAGINPAYGNRNKKQTLSDDQKSAAMMFGQEAIVIPMPSTSKSSGKKSKKSMTSTKAASPSMHLEVTNTTITEIVTIPHHVQEILKQDAAANIPPTSISTKVASVALKLPPPRRKEFTQYYYIYPLEEEYWWRWPKPGTDCNNDNNGYVGHEHSELSGLGRLLNADDGLFLTWHFSLFSSLYNRLTRSRRRTMDPDKATMFIIPYDLALDGSVNPDRCTIRRSCSRGLVPKLLQNITTSPYFLRHGGADHVMLWSLGQYHPWPHEACDTLMRVHCEKCTFTCYWMDATKFNNKFVSVPFPAAYHYHDGIKSLPWSLDNTEKRNQTAMYLGGTQTLNPTHTKIRRAMTEQCKADKDCFWYQIAHSSVDNTIADYLGLYKKSVFCLCPPGDDPARKAVFDSIVSGCIPVIFELNTLYNQYPWNIGEEVAKDISVYIPGLSVKDRKLQFMDHLRAISANVIRKKQQAIERLAPRLQYSAPPLELLKNKYDTTQWDPPFEDGVDAILDGMFERTSRVVRNESNHNTHRVQSGREWGKEYNTVIVKEPDMHTS